MQGKKPDMYMPTLQLAPFWPMTSPAHEVGQVAEADGVEPEDVVEGVMQTGGDEQAVEEGIDASADAAHSGNAVAESNEAVKDDGPHESRITETTMDTTAVMMATQRLPGEESQPVGKAGALNCCTCNRR